MKLKVFYFGVHKFFEIEDLVWNILRRMHPFELVESISKADIVINGVYSDNVFRTNLMQRTLNFFNRNLASGKTKQVAQSARSIYDPRKNQVWLHISGESPNNSPLSSFLNSECDFGFGHEPIHHKNYVRMPNWYQSIDWGKVGFPRKDAAFFRLGKPIAISELTTGISASAFKERNNRCALVSSHISSPRDVMISEIQRILPVDIYGLTGSGPVQYRSKLDKRNLLKEYSVVLAPENKLYPGYITEKIPETFACGALPIGWYLPGLNDDFAPQSHLNAANYGAASISNNGEFAAVLDSELKRVKSFGLPPLIEKPVTLEPIIELIENILVTAKSKR